VQEAASTVTRSSTSSMKSWSSLNETMAIAWCHRATAPVTAMKFHPRRNFSRRLSHAKINEVQISHVELQSRKRRRVRDSQLYLTSSGVSRSQRPTLQ
jgi:hypothetical protein